MWVDLEGLLLSEVKKTDKDIYDVISSICGKKKKVKTKKQADENRLEGGWGTRGPSWKK